MKGDFTSIRRWPFKHYTSVRMQQGRVQLDTDWNDQLELQQHLDRTEAVDVIGPAGGPKGAAGGFRVDRTPDGKDLTVSPGRFWVDGLLCELAGSASYVSQPDLPAPPFVTAGALALADGTYLAYLDVWERQVTVLEDPGLREPALRGADTTTRTQVVWQLKLLPVTDPGGAGTCDTAFPEWPPAPPTGKASARATVPSAGADRCTVEATGGYRRLENQLYRVEVHQGGTRAAGATFKWSRENGSVVAAWTGLTGDVLGVASPGRDRVLGFTVGDWVELTDDDRERTGTPGVLVKLKQVADTALAVDPTTFDPPGAVQYADFKSNPKVRRWEADLPSAASAARPLLPSPAGDGFIDLEDGVQVKFEDGDYRTGDYWVIPARTVLGDVIWPLDPVTKAPVPAPPLGVEHHLARLAIVRKAGANLTVTSCYPQFPPLTDITASDVFFDNGNCAFSPAATTVQEAIDDLCRRSGGGCHLVVAAGTDLQAFFDGLVQQQLTSVAVCLTAGTWNLDKAVQVRLTGDVVVSGAGPATKLIAAKAETALAFLGCASVTVSDLSLQTGATGTKAVDPASQHLNGTLQFQGCGAVTVERVVAQCGAGIERAAACVSVRPDPASPAATARVRLRGCDLSVGHRQVGVLLVNAARAQVEDNTISVWGRPANLGVLNGLKQSKAYRAMLRKRLFSGFSVAADSAAARVRAAHHAGPGTLALSLGGHLVLLQTQGQVAGPLRDTITSVATKLGAATEIVDLGAIAAQIRVLKATAGQAIPAARALAPTQPGGVVTGTAPAGPVVAAPATTVPETTVPPPGAPTPTVPSPAGPASGSPATGGTSPGGAAPGSHVNLPPSTGVVLDPAVLKSLEVFAGARMPADNVLKAMRQVVSPRVIRQRIHQIAKGILLTAGGADFKNWFGGLVSGSPASAYQGIAVVGAQADEVRLRGNTISGVLQGVHVAVSQRGNQRLQGGGLWIQDNTVQVLQPLDWKGERHGIFVGNFQSVVVEGNRLSLQRFTTTRDDIDGIRVYGLLGPRVVVENNAIDQFTRSVWVHPLNPADAPHALWLVSRNACSHASVTVVPEPGVQTGDLNVG